MASLRIEIKNALLARLQTAQFSTPINGLSTWGVTSRRLKLWNDVDSSVQPALYLLQHREALVNSGQGTPNRQYLLMGAWCYARTDSDSIIGDDLLDIMTEAIEPTLQADDPQTNNLTLGGLCTWCRLDRDSNQVIRDPGDIDGQALLVLPIQILFPEQQP